MDGTTFLTYYVRTVVTSIRRRLQGKKLINREGGIVLEGGDVIQKMILRRIIPITFLISRIEVYSVVLHLVNLVEATNFRIIADRIHRFIEVLYNVHFEELRVCFFFCPPVTTA